MTFRITSKQYTESFIGQLTTTRQRMEEVRAQLSSGLKVSKPSDDPGRAATILSLQNTVLRIDRHQERIAFAVNFMSAQENTMMSAQDVIIRLKELGTQAANGSISPQVRSQMADEVFALRDTLASLANTTVQGIYIYGGLDDNDPPYDYNSDYFSIPADGTPESGHWVWDADDPANTELGHSGTRVISISDSETVRINTSGAVFKDAINAATVLGRALRGYATTLEDVDGDGEGVDLPGYAGIDDPSRTQSAAKLTFPGDEAVQHGEINKALAMLDNARTKDIQRELSSLGARLARLSQVNEILDTIKINTEQARSTVQDADIFTAANDLAQLQTNLEALLASASRIGNMSLLDFI